MKNLFAINATVYALMGLEPGKALPSHTSLGCYPLVYLTLRQNCLCAKCANGWKDDMDPVIEGAVHWEGNSIDCAECGSTIESAYGEAAE